MTQRRKPSSAPTLSIRFVRDDLAAQPWIAEAITAGISEATTRLQLWPAARWEVEVQRTGNEHTLVVILGSKDVVPRRERVVVVKSIVLLDPVVLRRETFNAIRDDDREDRAVELFAVALGDLGLGPAEVIARPERDNESTGQGDAIIRRAGSRLAVEHTTVDFLKDQRDHRERFYRVLDPLRVEVPKHFPGHAVKVQVGYGAVPKGKGIYWDAIKEALIQGVIRELAMVEDRPEPLTVGPVLNLPGVPFEVRVGKWPDRGDPLCFVFQGISPEVASGENLAENIRAALVKKRGKLAEYRKQSIRTALLLDSDQIEVQGLANAVGKAKEEALLTGFDEIWVARTDTERRYFCPVMLDGRVYPDLPEFRQSWETLFQRRHP